MRTRLAPRDHMATVVHPFRSTIITARVWSYLTRRKREYCVQVIDKRDNSTIAQVHFDVRR